MPGTHAYPVSPPRVRVEWLIAASRVALAVAALVAITLDTPGHVPQYLIAAVLGLYLLYSLAVLALVWSPVRFVRGWGLAVHVFDLVIFVFVAGITDTVMSPFFASFTFLVISATLRWQARGTVLTVVIALVAYGAFSLYGPQLFGPAEFRLNIFLIRAIYLITIATLLGCFASIQERSHVELVRMASWPRRVSRDPRHAVSEVIAQSEALLEAPRVVLIWEDTAEGRINLAWRGDDDLIWTHEPEGTYGALVLPVFEKSSFQAADADSEGETVSFTEEGFRYRQRRPINEALRARFNMKEVQSWPLAGELIQGRLFALDKHRMRIDDLVLGDVVARLAVTRLDTLYLVERLREAAALEARVRVARDLHDSLLQSHTGVALQLLVARRLLDADPVAGRARLEEVQRTLESSELDMRSFIRSLRPEDGSRGHPDYSRLADRLDVLRRRIAREWDVKVVLRLQGADSLSGPIVEDIYRLVQEGAINAARHADPSVIKIDLTVDEDTTRLGITDDGRGFPFQGMYDLATLSAMRQGPLTLKERVAALQGHLVLQSNDTGTQILITLPLVPVSH
jgi:signal transduction histidine kinase